jgi:hypothetical protein
MGFLVGSFYRASLCIHSNGKIQKRTVNWIQAPRQRAIACCKIESNAAIIGIV